MVAAYSSDAGLKAACPFTKSRERLLRAIEAIYVDPKMKDTWALELTRRMCECATYPDPFCPPAGVNPAQCMQHARMEHAQGRRSFRAFQAFLDGLDRVPGRKSVLFFFENAAIIPNRFYGTGRSAQEYDHVAALNDVASSATLARASVYPVYAGDHLGFDAAIATLAVNLGANLADFTGGRYNRGTGDLGGILDAAARGACCVYRIGLEPPDRPSRHAYQAAVTARDRAVPWRYRVRFETGEDRWLKSTQAVLTSPESATEMDVSAALVPTPAGLSRWDLSALVALDLASLVHLPVGERREARWEVGALLVRQPDGPTWEMLAVSRVESKSEPRGEKIIHRAEIRDLKPGTYRLTTFARDRAAGLFGGAQSEIEGPGPASIVGPVLLRSSTKCLLAPLPLTSDRSAAESRVSEAQERASPLENAPVEPGQPLEAHTWLCAGKWESAAPAPCGSSLATGLPVSGSRGRGPPADGVFGSSTGSRPRGSSRVRTPTASASRTRRRRSRGARTSRSALRRALRGPEEILGKGEWLRAGRGKPLCATAHEPVGPRPAGVPSPHQVPVALLRHRRVGRGCARADRHDTRFGRAASDGQQVQTASQDIVNRPRARRGDGGVPRDRLAVGRQLHSRDLRGYGECRGIEGGAVRLIRDAVIVIVRVALVAERVAVRVGLCRVRGRRTVVERITRTVEVSIDEQMGASRRRVAAVVRTHVPVVAVGRWTTDTGSAAARIARRARAPVIAGRGIVRVDTAHRRIAAVVRADVPVVAAQRRTT